RRDQLRWAAPEKRQRPVPCPRTICPVSPGRCKQFWRETRRPGNAPQAHAYRCPIVEKAQTSPHVQDLSRDKRADRAEKCLRSPGAESHAPDSGGLPPPCGIRRWCWGIAAECALPPAATLGKRLADATVRSARRAC